LYKSTVDGCDIDTNNANKEQQKYQFNNWHHQQINCKHPAGANRQSHVTTWKQHLYQGICIALSETCTEYNNTVLQ